MKSGTPSTRTGICRGTRKSERRSDMCNHKTKRVTLVPAYREDIDVKLAPLISLLWEVGIQPEQCCQEENPGFASITFPELDMALDFLNLVARPGRAYVVEVETWKQEEDGQPCIV